MPPRFDSETHTLRLSVADLIDTALLRSVGFANRGGYERMWLGQAIHSRYQEAALADDPSYRREVKLSLEMVHRGWQVVIEGRADGLRREEDGTLVVEEIKSVRRGGQPSPTVMETYRRQALLYCWMLARQGEEAVRGELVLIEIGSDAETRESIEAETAAMQAVVQRRLNSIIRDFDRAEADRVRRRAAADDLDFPYPDLRPGQELIVDAVERALEQREHLLVEAATGIGKTVAALQPALAYALAHDKRIYVLTAKTLQQEMATSVLELLNVQQAFHSMQLRAKAKMCANDEVICHEEYCPYARDFALKMQRSRVVPNLLDTHGTLLPDLVFEAARAAEVCPFEVSLELSNSSQVVVCDYNYAFAPYIALSHFGPEADLSDTILVIDEIHNLVDRGRGYYSPELSADAARATAELVGRGGQRVHRRIRDACRELADVIESTAAAALDHEPGRDAAIETELPERRLWALRPELDAAFIDYLEFQRETKSFRAEDPFVGLYFDFLRFLDGLMLSGGEDFAHTAERRSGGHWIRVLCKDASRFLGEVLGRAHCVVGLSATLSPPEFYRDLLGFDAQRTVTVSVPDPFPSENRRVVIDPTVATTWRDRADNYQPIADRLSGFAETVPGNCLVLFPSYQFLDQVAGRLVLSQKRLVVQSRAAGDREREAVLDTLRSSLLGDVLLLAVAGGVFAEGVDYPGEMLKAVAIVGPCLPPVTLERQLLKEYYQQRFERGFEYAFVVPGMTRVVQAAGRLIRSAEDTGVIALLDKRFLARPYRKHLPAGWLGHDEAEALTADPARAGEEFFRTVRAR